MPMGIVSDSDFDLEKSKLNSTQEPQSIPPRPVTGQVVDKPSPGRGAGNVEVPNGLRKLIGETSDLDGRQEALELARQFGISPSSVSAYANGSTSTSSYDKTPNQPHIDTARNRVSNRARARLMSALRHITDEKLGSTSARELAGVARDMSAIIKNMEPDTPKSPNGNGDKGPTFIFYSPQLKKEEHYDVVRVQE